MRIPGSLPDAWNALLEYLSEITYNILTEKGKETMSALAESVLNFAAKLPEGKPTNAKSLLHLGGRAAVDQALSRLAKRGKLIRVARGLYLHRVEGRFGVRPPTASNVVERIAEQRGEIVVASGAAAANTLGLTTQVPVREVYLTSGPSRRLQLGAQVIELRHAPAWQLILPGRAAGSAVRALGWLGRERAHKALATLPGRLSEDDLRELIGARARLPTWMAREVSTLVAHG